MRRSAFAVLTALCLAFPTGVSNCKAIPAREENTEAAHQTSAGLSSGIARIDAYEDITWGLITIAEHDPELKRLLEKAA